MNTNPTRRSPDEILRSSIPFEIIQHASSMFAHAKYALVMWLIASAIIYVLTKFPILSDHGTLLSGMIALATLSSSLWIYSVKSAALEFPLPQAGSEKEALIENLVLRHFKVCAKASALSAGLAVITTLGGGILFALQLWPFALLSVVIQLLMLAIFTAHHNLIHGIMFGGQINEITGENFEDLPVGRYYTKTVFTPWIRRQMSNPLTNRFVLIAIFFSMIVFSNEIDVGILNAVYVFMMLLYFLRVWISHKGTREFLHEIREYYGK